MLTRLRCALRLMQACILHLCAAHPPSAWRAFLDMEVDASDPAALSVAGEVAQALAGCVTHTHTHRRRLMEAAHLPHHQVSPADPGKTPATTDFALAVGGCVCVCARAYVVLIQGSRCIHMTYDRSDALSDLLVHAISISIVRMVRVVKILLSPRYASKNGGRIHSSPHKISS